MQCLHLIIILSIFVKSVHNFNILAVFPIPIRSHVSVLQPLVELLLKRGHNIDVVTHFPLKINSPKYKDYSVHGSLPIYNNVSFERSYIMNFAHITWILERFLVDDVESMLHTRTMKELKDSSKKYDLLMVHLLFGDYMLGLSHYFDVPTVGIITSVNLPWTGDFIGLPDNPSYIPNYFSSFGQKMTYFQRMMNTITYVFTKYSHWKSVSRSKQLAEGFLGDNLLKTEHLFSRLSLILSNSHFTINQARPTVPNFVEIGGVHIDGNTTLPENLDSLLNSEPNDVIYLSFGSMIKTEKFLPEKLQAIFDVFAQLPFTVLWKGNKFEFPKLNIPGNVHFQSWMPQLGILCHPKTKLFISHGGLLGTQEAIYCGVPVLGIPFVVDQGLNIKSMQEKEIALHIAYEDITKELFLGTVKTLLEKKYKNNAENLSKQFKDRPMSPVETAIYWIEYVIKYKGAPQLRSMASDLPWYQYYLVDVILTLAVLFLFIFIVTFKIALKVYSLCINVSLRNTLYICKQKLLLGYNILNLSKNSNKLKCN